MTKVEEFEYKVKNAKNKSDEWWIALYEEIQEYKKTAPEKDKIRITQLGCGEVVAMMYEGIMYEREKDRDKNN